jgi:phospholipase/carboxylesterase
MTKTREFSVCEPELAPDACVIWLHGLGADGSDFMGVVDQLGLPNDHRVRFIFPNAPFINVTVNQGMKMRGWYDIYDLNLLRKEDEPGVINSQQFLEELINQEIEQGIASERIILAGFSQGGAIALYTGLRYSRSLGGIIVLSAYLPIADKFSNTQFPENHATPIFIAHGLFDPVVPLNAGKTSCQLLEKQNYKIDWKTYPMAHTVTIEEISAIGSFINRCLNYA